MKKFMIITGSPRKDGNSDRIAKAFADEFANAGNDAEIFRIDDKEVNHCKTCGYCKSHDGCVQSDDASKLIERLKTCDGAVFVAPVYFGNIPGTNKVLTDRFYSAFNLTKPGVAPDPDRKLSIVFTCGGTPEELLAPASAMVNSCFALVGYGAHQMTAMAGNNTPDAFDSNEAHQAKVKEMAKWMME